MLTQQVRESAITTLEKQGKTFRWASLFLSQDRLLAAAELYQLCRELDDGADVPEHRAASASTFRSLIERLSLPVFLPEADIEVRADNLVRTHGVPKSALVSLVEGLVDDINHQPFISESQLLRYAYRVAGTVGLMMCPILGVQDPKAYHHAIDLGIAMQLTNISRDVLEDAQMGRRYLPIDLSTDALCRADKETRRCVQARLEEQLDLAETYYRSGLVGLSYLPRRNRVAIYLAAYLYRAIGRKIKRKGVAWWEGRTVIGSWEKACLTLLSVPRLVAVFCNWKLPARHAADLHLALDGLPFTDGR